MKQNPTLLRRSAVLAPLVVLLSQTDAFTTRNPCGVTKSQLLVPTVKPSPESPAITPMLQLFNGNNNEDTTIGDWKGMVEEASRIGSIVGQKGLELIGKGGSAMKNLAAKSTESLKAMLFPSDSKKAARQDPSPPPMVDTDDEELFRDIWTDLEDRNLANPYSTSDWINRVVDQAAVILQENEIAAWLLGAFIQHSYPISQRSKTKTVDGKIITEVEASFELYGLQGRGVAVVGAVNDKITSLYLQVNREVYRIRPATTTWSSRPKVSNTKAPQRWEPLEDDAVTLLEVEVMEGVRRLSPPKSGRVIEAEIVKKVLL